MASKYLVAVGACYIDTILSVPHFIVEDEKLRAAKLTRRRGGNCPNTVEVLQQLLNFRDDLDLATSLLVVLPHRDSAAAKEVRQSLGPGVRLAESLYRNNFVEPASSYIIKNQANGSRTIINHNDLPEMRSDEYFEAANSLGNKAIWYHFEGRIPSITLECIRYVRRLFPSTRISVEVEKPGRDGLEDLAAEADVVFYSKSWACGKGYSSAQDCLRSQSKRCPKAVLLCCTWGDEGATTLEPETMSLHEQVGNIPENTQVVDTIGAGDTFIAGMLYSCLAHSMDWSMDQKLKFSIELAGRKVVQEGFAGLAEFMQDRV